jgi:hypothetical protein
MIRDFKISKNHQRRVRSIVVKSNEQIVRMLDHAKAQHLENERREVKDETIRWKAIADTLEWLINGDAK